MSLAQRSRALVRPFRARFWPFALAAAFSAGYRRRVISASTQLVIEGSPRSGNSFFQTYVEIANPGLANGAIAHHTHAAGQVREAVRRGLPTAVLIREPLDAAASVHLRARELSVEAALRDYVQFQTTVRGHADGLLAIDFATAITRPEIAVSALNRRFSLDLAAPPLDASLRAQIFDILDAENLVYGGGRVLAVARPDDAKATARRRLEVDIEGRAPDLLQRAQLAYREVCALGGFVTADGAVRG